MLLTSLVRIAPDINGATEEDPEDIFTSALGSIFTDDAQNMHGSPGSSVIYKSNVLGDIRLELADPEGEDGRLLFAHYLWNAGIFAAELISEAYSESKGEVTKPKESFTGDGGYHSEGAEWRERYRGGKMGQHDWSVIGEAVLELGAGSGLVSIVAVASGASRVVATDYPDPQILKPIQTNVNRNQDLFPDPSAQPDAKSCAGESPSPHSSIFVNGHAWGSLDEPFALSQAHAFSRVIACDTLWMAAQHENLAASMHHFLSLDEKARVWVIAGFHTGRERVADFFDAVMRQGKLELEDRWEVDTEVQEREWSDTRVDDISERKKWMVVARFKRVEDLR